MLDFPNSPAMSQVFSDASGASWYWDGAKWSAMGTSTAGWPFLPLSGGVMGGNLTLAGNATSPLHAVPLQQVNTAAAGGPFLPLAGGTVTGTLGVTGALTSGAITSAAHVIPASGGLQGTTWLAVGNNKNLTNAGALSPVFSVGVGTISGTLTGSIPSVTQIFNGADTADGTGATNQPVLLKVAQAYGGSNMKGGRAAVTMQSSLTATSGNAPTRNPFYTVLNAWLTMQATDGGTAPTLAGGIGQAIAFNPQVVFGATATNFLEASVVEADFALAAGSSVARKFGIKIVQLSPDATRGTVADAAIKIGGTVGWKTSILFGGDISPWPATAVDTLIAGQASTSSYSPVAAYGIDFRQVAFPAFSTTAEQGLIVSNGFAVDGVGAIRSGTAYIMPSSTGVSVDVKGIVGTGTPTVSAGGTGYSVGDFLFDPWGGIYQVLTISGGTTGPVLTVKLYNDANGNTRQPYYPNSTPPSNPVSVSTWGISLGSGCTLTLSWNTTATTLSLNPTGKQVLTNLSAAATDAAAASAGVPIGGLYNNAGVVHVRLT